MLFFEKEMTMDLSGTAIANFFQTWALSLWKQFNEVSWYILLGLFFAGLLHVFIPRKFILKALGKEGIGGAVRGALVGLPLPLCSCSVVPTSIALRKQGASVASTTSFIISTPETSIDALSMTFALLPLSFLGLRPFAAFVLAVAVGVTVEAFLKAGLRIPFVSVQGQLRRDILSLSQAMNVRNEDSLPFDSPSGNKFKALFKYSFVDFFEDIAFWFALGLLFSSLVDFLVPDLFFKQHWIGQSTQAQIWLSILLGVPLYTCASATTPLVATLLAKGLNPGAALALLLAGPATNISNIFVYRKEFGSHFTFLYYAALVAFTWALSTAVSLTYPMISSWSFLGMSLNSVGGQAVAAHSHQASSSEGPVALLQIFSTGTLLILYGKFVVKKILSRRKAEDDCCHDDH